MKRIRTLLKDTKGETLVESMFAFVIILLVALMLPACIMAASNINKTSKSAVTTCTLDRSGTPTETDVSITSGSNIYTVTVDSYESDGVFNFYDYGDE
jgi:guanyl-specific ribonuclease Sa